MKPQENMCKKYTVNLLRIFFFFFFFYERDFMKPLSRENQADIIEAFNSTPRYLDDLLNIKKNCGKD